MKANPFYSKNMRKNNTKCILLVCASLPWSGGEPLGMKRPLSKLYYTLKKRQKDTQFGIDPGVRVAGEEIRFIKPGIIQFHR